MLLPVRGQATLEQRSYDFQTVADITLEFIVLLNGVVPFSLTLYMEIPLVTFPARLIMPTHH